MKTESIIQSSNKGKVNMDARTHQPNSIAEFQMNLKDSMAKCQATAITVGLVVFYGSDDTIKIADFITKFELFIVTVGFVDEANKYDILNCQSMESDGVPQTF